MIVGIIVHYMIVKLDRGNGYMRELSWLSLLSFNAIIAKYLIGAASPHNENRHARFLSQTQRLHPIIVITTPTTVATSPLVRPVSKAVFAGCGEDCS